MRYNEAFYYDFIVKSMETEKTTLANGWKAIVEQILASEETNKSKVYCKVLTSGIFYQHLYFFSPNFVYVLHWFTCIKVDTSEILLAKLFTW